VEQKFQQNGNEKRELFYNNLKDVLADSCFIMMKTAEHEREILKPITYHKRTALTSDEIANIEAATIGQSENEAWHRYRKGRITASNFYRVYTKVESIISTGVYANTAEKLVESLLGSNKPPENLPSLKYGRNMESTAKERYLMYFQEKHRETSIRECGLFIHETKQYIGASPDSLVECACCGKGVLEIKCPSSIISKIPNPENVSYLVSKNGQVTLKENHKYFAQVQGQMAITKRRWCHFFVYTQVGQHFETILFNESYWQKLEENLTWFFANYLT
jgi:hypothetical protein